MLNEANIPEEHAALFGEAHPLIQRLGSPEAWASLSSPLSSRLESVTNVPTLRRFLEFYRHEVLAPTELPSILRGYQFASHNQARELIEFDCSLAKNPLFLELASASQRVGRTQLRRLRPLRDSRLVQRYLDAIEGGEAHGWHTLVYGVALSLYSLPLRQGLNGYAQQTVGGFIHTAQQQLRLPEIESGILLEEMSATLPGLVEGALAAPSESSLRFPAVAR